MMHAAKIPGAICYDKKAGKLSVLCLLRDIPMDFSQARTPKIGIKFPLTSLNQKVSPIFPQSFPLFLWLYFPVSIHLLQNPCFIHLF